MNAWWTKYLPEIVREWLEGRQQLQKAIGNTGWLFVDRIMRIVIGLTVGAWMARYLGPNQFGELAYVITFIAFFQVIANLQADGFIVRDIAQARENPSLILGTALWLRLGFGMASWLGAAASMYLLHPEEIKLFWLTVIIGGSLVFQAADTVDLWFQSQSKSRRTVAAKFISYILSNGVKVILLVTKAPLIAFAAVISLESAALALSLARAYHRQTTGTGWKASLVQAKHLLGTCWPFMVSNLMTTVFMRIDQIMLKEMLGEKTVGIYAAALSISNVWTVVPLTLVTSLAPFVAQKMSRDEHAYEEALVKIFRLFAVVALSGASITAVASHWIIKILYGPQYEYSSVILCVHVFANIFIFQGIAQDLWVINKDVKTVTLLANIAAAIIGTSANAIMIKTFGPLGAVYSFMIATACSVIIIPCVLRRDLWNLYKRAFLRMSTPIS